MRVFSSENSFCKYAECNIFGRTGKTDSNANGSNGKLVLISGKEKKVSFQTEKRNQMLKMEENIYAVLIRKMGHYVLDSGCPC